MRTARHSSTRSGAALIIVIALVSMLMVLIVAFFSLSRIERRASRAYAQSVASDVLSESALNTVIAQIRDATSNLGTTETWASQPGMLRRFNDGGSLIGAYKLYSSKKMVEGGSFDPSGEVPPGDWRSKPGLWVDLNEPVIFDRDGDGNPDDEDGDGKDDASYPIVHPAAINQVDGFSIENAPGASDNQPIPMPVEWLYMLQDGTLTSASSAGAAKIRVEGAKAGNPVVGRIAFWADDECSKVNINTASEGTFWDIPRTNSRYEMTYSNSQPVQGEFQRYTGHPAMTCLSPVLGKWLGNPEKEPNATRRIRILDNYYKLTPRIVGGGSNGGINEVTEKTDPIDFSKDQNRLYASVDEYVFDAAGLAENTRDTNQGMKSETGRRLGAEAVRDVIEKTRFFLTSHSQAPEVNLFNQPRIALWPIQADEANRNLVDDLIAFCSSTGSDSRRTPYYFQRATVHNLRSPTGFSSSQSTTTDWNIGRNQDLYKYMQHLMTRPVPGYGGDFAGKYGPDSDQILTEMVDYLRSGLNTYALSSNRSESYSYAPPRKMNQSAGARGEAQIVPLRINDTKGFGRFVTVTEAALVLYPADDIKSWNAAKYAERRFKPRTPAGPKTGFHCEYVRAFMLLEFYCPSVGLPSWSPYVDIQIEGLDGFEIAGGGEPASLHMPGSATVRSHTPIGLGPGTTGDKPEVGGGNITAHFGIFQPLYAGDYQKEPTLRDPNETDPETGYAFHSTAAVRIPGAVPARDAPAGTLELKSGSPLTIILKSPATGEVVQTIEMQFPACTMPRPYIYAKNGSGETADELETDLQKRFAEGAGNFHWALIRPGDVVRSMEPDRNAEPKGDLRFHAAVQKVPREWFTTGGMVDNATLGRDRQTRGRNQLPAIRVKQYFDSDEVTGRFAHGLRQDNDWQFYGQFCAMQEKEDSLDAIRGNYSSHPYFRMAAMRTAGVLLPELHLYKEGEDTARTPAVYRDAHFVTSRDLMGAFRSDGKPGDFDSGFGHTEDGCYINKPDEGNSYGRPFNWGGGDRIGGYNNRGHYVPDEKGINHVPNRQIASAVQMGSLPTGIMNKNPWQTLLFNPVPSGDDHPGAKPPHDHLLLDWWWMPVAQPYPISQPMATSGKININYDIVPFRYIKRRTPIHSLMKSVRIGAIPKEAASRWIMQTNYRQGTDAPLPYETRFAINYEDLAHGTLRGFEDKFEKGEIFRSASEICEIPLVPRPIDGSLYWPGMASGATYSNMERWWQSNAALTGDNMRETPYNHIYPRCTTKSNTFRVHLHVQRVIPGGSDPSEIDLKLAKFAGDWRGSILIERFVDPNDPALPDFATENEKSLDDFYRVRILERKEFRPL